MRKIRSGDTVLVTSGKNKGQQGKVRINVVDDDRVVIEGVNIVKKHIKRGRARQAGIVEVEAPLPVSNVMLHVHDSVAQSPWRENQASARSSRSGVRWNQRPRRSRNGRPP